MKVHSDIDGLAFAAMKAMMLHEAQEHALPVVEDTATRLQVRTEYGAFGITDRAPKGLRLDVEADRADNLYVLRDSLVGHIEHFLPEVAQTISWSDDVAAGQLPPNFQFATVTASEPLTTTFRRLRLRLAKPELFDDRAIHFRFVLPRADETDPVWPTIAPNGSTRWPSGAQALPRPFPRYRGFLTACRATRWARSFC